MRIENMARLLVLANALTASRSLMAVDVPVGRFVDLRPVSAIADGEHLDCCQALSPNGLTLLFASNARRPSNGGFDIYRLTRDSPSEAFGNLANAGAPLSSSFTDAPTSYSFDGETLYFYSSRSDGMGSNDLYSARVTDDGFTDVANLTAVNSPSTEWSPAISPNGLELYFVSNRSGTQGSRDLYKASRQDTSEPFGNVERLDNLNSDTYDDGPSFSSDGLHLFMVSARDEGGLFVASRSSTSDAFEAPVNLNDFSLGSQVNLPGITELIPTISHDWPAPGSKIYFTRIVNPDEVDDVFTIRDWDIYEATWVPEPGCSVLFTASFLCTCLRTQRRRVGASLI